MRCNDLSLVSFGDIENLDGLGGTRSGLAGILSLVEASKEETESTTRSKLFITYSSVTRSIIMKNKMETKRNMDQEISQSCGTAPSQEIK